MNTKTRLVQIVTQFFIGAEFGNFTTEELTWAATTLREIAARCDEALTVRGCPNSSWGCRDPHCVEHRGAKAVPFDVPDPRD